MQAKNTKELLEQIKKLNKENNELQQLLRAANESLAAVKAGNIDALVVANKKDIKIYTEQKADKIYRTLIEKMREGAITINEEGTVLYSNSYFANLVCLPLQKVIGAKFRDFIHASSKKTYTVLIKKGWQGYSQDEIFIAAGKNKVIPALMSVNTLSLENAFVLSIILTDITLQNRNRAAFKSILAGKIINVITEMNYYSDEFSKMNYSGYISKKLNHNYTYLSNIFSEIKGFTIQQFIILHKIEKVKELLLYGELNLTEISYKLHYSSVAHLSNQFKKITGLSPSFFKQTKQRNNQEGTQRA
jgi:PAS domain S-box-containing protein